MQVLFFIHIHPVLAISWFLPSSISNTQVSLDYDIDYHSLDRLGPTFHM